MSEEAEDYPARGAGARRPRRELAQELDVLSRGESAVLFEPLLRERVELRLGRIDVHVHAVHMPELAQLRAGEGRLRGAAPPEHHDLLDAALTQRIERVVGHVSPFELGGAAGQQARDVRRDVAVADHDRALRREVELEPGVVGMAVVPGDEFGRGPAARQVLARDSERLVGLCAGGVDDGGVVLHQLGVRDVHADLDVAEEAAAAPEGLAVECLVQALDLLVVRRHAAAQQSPRGGQALEEVDRQSPRWRSRRSAANAPAGPAPTTATR